MLDNFAGHDEKEYAVKLQPDGTEIPFHFKYYEELYTNEEKFLSNLSMLGSIITLRTSKDLNWKPKDVILLGRERTRYQVNEVRTIKRKIQKNYMLVKGKSKFDYLLLIGA